MYGVQLVISRDTNDKSQHKDELNTLVGSGVFILLSKYAAVKSQTEARKLLNKRDDFIPDDVKRKFDSNGGKTPHHYNCYTVQIQNPQLQLH
jgi:hypothetical protein